MIHLYDTEVVNTQYFFVNPSAKPKLALENNSLEKLASGTNNMNIDPIYQNPTPICLHIQSEERTKRNMDEILEYKWMTITSQSSIPPKNA